jgi:Nucleotide-diphospho-sugar transferase
MKLTQHKIEVVLRMLERYRVPIVFADVDIVFLQKHILTYLEQLLTAGKYDFLMSRDRYDKVMFVNSGVYMVAPSDYAIDYLKQVVALKHASGQYNFNKLLGNVTEWHHFHMLPIELFNNGQVRDFPLAVVMAYLTVRCATLIYFAAWLSASTRTDRTLLRSL